MRFVAAALFSPFEFNIWSTRSGMSSKVGGFDGAAAAFGVACCYREHMDKLKICVVFALKNSHCRYRQRFERLNNRNCYKAYLLVVIARCRSRSSRFLLWCGLDRRFLDGFFLLAFSAKRNPAQNSNATSKRERIMDKTAPTILYSINEVPLPSNNRSDK